MADEMSDKDQPSAMRRKAGAGRPPPEFGQITAGVALRAALAQAAQDVAALVAMAGSVDEARMTLERVTEDLTEHALLALVEGPQSRFGLVVLEPQVTAALIEIQTTGRVVPRPAEPRTPTRTDAIMCADFIDQVLEQLETRVGEADLTVAPALTGFRYALALAEPRAIAMTLDDVPYRRFSCRLDLGQGAKEGAIQLILPFDAPGNAGARGHDHEAFADALAAQVMGARVNLSATLIRRAMPLSDVAALRVGSLIPLPRAALNNVAIEDLSGDVVIHGRLGQVNGSRAVRINFAAGLDEHDIGGGSVAGLAERPPDLAGVDDIAASAALSDGLGGLTGDLSGLGGLDDPGALSGMGRLDDPNALAGLGGLDGSTGLAGLDGDLAELAAVPALPDLP